MQMPSVQSYPVGHGVPAPHMLGTQRPASQLCSSPQSASATHWDPPPDEDPPDEEPVEPDDDSPEEAPEDDAPPEPEPDELACPDELAAPDDDDDDDDDEDEDEDEEPAPGSGVPQPLPHPPSQRAAASANPARSMLPIAVVFMRISKAEYKLTHPALLHRKRQGGSIRRPFSAGSGSARCPVCPPETGLLGAAIRSTDRHPTDVLPAPPSVPGWFPCRCAAHP